LICCLNPNSVQFIDQLLFRHLLPSFNFYASFPEIANQLSLGVDIARGLASPHRHPATWGDQPEMAVILDHLPSLSLNFSQNALPFVIHRTLRFPIPKFGPIPHA
jgi:hypothetical protein